MSSTDPQPLLHIWKARDWLQSVERDAASDKLPSAREALAEAVEALLSDVASREVEETERRALDAALAPHAASLKGALLKALRVCSCARGFLGLPAVLEQTRRLLTAAPAKGVSTYLEDNLCKDIGSCTDARALAAVADVQSALLGQGRLKKDLGGFDLPAPHKKSCRTALNRATKALTELEAAERVAAAASNASTRPAQRFHMERDVRLDDAEEAASREAGRSQGLDALFDQASLK
jgi:hypothetical protein